MIKTGEREKEFLSEKSNENIDI
jgi:hypothetical protein